MYPQTDEEYQRQLREAIKHYLTDPAVALGAHPHFRRELLMVHDGHETNPYVDHKGRFLFNHWTDALIWADVKEVKNRLLEHL